jgi:precorrin-6A/cobalt-precorrin-6A reductase
VATGPIWLIGGTHESAQLAIAIAKTDLACIVSVTTEAAKALYPVTTNLQVVVGKFCSEQLEQFLQTQKITVILDASHPYAVEISQLAIAAATQLQIPYLRFERPVLEAVPDDNSPIITLDSFATLLAGSYLQRQRVLLTVGYKPLSLFAAWQNQTTLFARILPSMIALEAAISAGFQPERLFAMRPPVPAEIERALWQHWQISLVVTKASGKLGGEDIKQAVATELGVTLVVITRPNMPYPQQTSDLSTALEFCYRHANDSRI